MITLSMIVKNEEKYLEDCLKSVQGVVGEIIIVDTGSTDNTISIAEKYGAKVFFYKWANDFAAARNYALENSTGDWILYLDADERLNKNSKDELKKITSGRNNKAFYCRIKNIDSTNNRPSVMAYIRLFPNNKNVRFEGAIHEQIEPALLRNNYTIENSTIEIDHIGYNISKDSLKIKAQRNLEILLSEYNKKKTSYIAFHLGQTYGMLDEKQKAMFYFGEALNDASLKNEYKSLAFRYLAVCNAEMLNWNNAVELINKSIQIDPSQPLNLMAASQIFLNMGQYKNAGILCKKAYEANRIHINKKKFSYQSILLDDKTITRHGLNAAVLSNDKELYNFFMQEANIVSNEKSDSLNDLKLFEILIDNKSVTKDEINFYTEFVDDKNLDLVITLLDKYNLIDSKINILSKLANKFTMNSSVLNKLGLVLAEGSEYFKAEEVLKKSLTANANNPSTIFYLSSVLFHNSKIDEIKSLISVSEKKFSQFPAILNMLQSLKTKLKIVS